MTITTRRAVFLSSMCLGLHLFGGLGMAAATVTATLKNVNNNNAPAVGTRIKLYTLPTREISNSNPASFTGVTAGLYTIEGYYTGTFWGEEFWASTLVSVPSSGIVSPTLPRQYGIATAVVIKNNATGATISSGQSVNAGTQLRVEVTIQNNLPGTTLNSRPHVAIDRSQSASYDFDLNWTSQPVNGNGATKLFTSTFTPNTTGQYYFAYEIQTTLANANTLRTDSAGWQQTFQIVCPTPTVSSDPSPADGALSVSTSLTLLNWPDASAATSYDVYFGTDSTPDAGEFRQNVTSSQWIIDQSLNEGTIYYWKIVAKNSCGSTDGSVWDFTTVRTTGDVIATLRKLSGDDAPPAGTRIKLYTSSPREVSGFNPATFATVSAGSYTIEGYYTGTFWGEEYWASTQVAVNAGQTSMPLLPRRYPYVTGVVFKNHATGATLFPGQTVNAGTQLRAEVTVRNDVPSATLDVAVHLALDLSQSPPYDFDLNASALPVTGSGGTRLYILPFTANLRGQLYYAYEVNTTLANASTLRTDSAGWQQTVQVSAPPITVTGRVAYHVDSDNRGLHPPTNSNDGNIFVCNLPNGTPVNITGSLSVKNALNPHFSPDGAKLTFMAIPNSQPVSGTSLEIFLFDLAEQKLLRLTTNNVPDEDPKFSPDGTRIVFKRSDSSWTNGQIWTMNIDGSGTNRLTGSAGEKSGPNFSPDGTQIIFWRGARTNADIATVLTNGTSETTLINEAGLQEYYPIFRDNQTVLYARWESLADHHDRLYSYSLSSNSSTPLPFNQSGPDVENADPFLMTSQYVGFSSGSWPNYDLFIGDPVTGDAVPLSNLNSPLGELGASFSPFTNALKLAVQDPANGTQLTSGSTALITLRAYSNGGVWSGATPKLVLQGPVNTEFTDLNDNGINGDQTAGDGIYSKSVSLPSQSGTYSVHAVADSIDNGITHQIRSASLTVTLQEPPDTTSPIVNISSPTDGQDFTTPNITVIGTASDPGSPSTGVKLVEVRVNNGTWETTTGTGSWSRPATLRSGVNFLEARSLDVGGNYSSTVTVTVTYTPPNSPPSLAPIADKTFNEETLLAFAVSASDPDPQPQEFTFSLNPGFPLGAAIDPASGIFTWTPTELQGPGTYPITVRVTDSSPQLLSDAKTFTVTVTEVNRPPTFTRGSDQTVNEDAGPQTVSNWATGISTGPPGDAGTVVTFLVDNNNHALFAGQPQISANGTLTYTPAANANGIATVTVSLKDDGGTANGGQDTSATQTFTIIVGAANDSPTFAKGANQTVNEDAGPQTVSNWATAMSAGPVDEAEQTLTFLVSSDNPGMFVVQPAVGASGNLNYTPAANANGTATVTVRLQDNGGTADGGIDTSAAQTFSITINPVNDAPSFTKGADQTVNEDAGPQTIVGWATVLSAGAANESVQVLTFVVTHDNPSLFSAPPAVGADGTLTYTPAADANGIANVTVTLKDNAGTANGGVDTSAPQRLTITVNAVNDAPSFVKGPDQTISEGAGPQSVSNWATSIRAGPANESSQTVNLNVTGNSNPSLFTAGPAVNSSGTLNYTPAANASGSATITLVAQDNGGTANGGVDTSAPQAFVIEVSTAAPLHIAAASISLTNGNLSFNWPVQTGKTYRVQYKDRLSDSTWTDLPTAPTVDGSTASIADIVGMNRQRFYRVVVAP